MTKTQIRILQLAKHSERIHGIRRFLVRCQMFLLEILVVLHRFFSIFYRGKSQTFELFAERDEFGSYQESYTHHEQFRKTSAGGVALVLLLATIYVLSGVLLPGQLNIRAATYTVTELTDTGDGTCDGTCTLRDAILNANASTGVADSISFSAPGTIELTSPLPGVSDQLVIDGDTDNDGDPDVVIDGSANNIDGNGIALLSNDNVIEGVVISGFSGVGIFIQGSNNQVISSYIGTDATGMTAIPNDGGGISIGDDGVTASTQNVIGGTTSATRNVISGNGFNGVQLAGELVQNNTVSGNYIGVTSDGVTSLSNGIGILLNNGADNNTLGGDLDGGQPGTAPGNIISGNSGQGILITNANTSANVVAGNIIGLAVDGSTEQPNGTGISIDGNNTGTVVGGVDADFRNVISGNNAQGITIDNDSGTIRGNYIGLNRAGTTAVANSDGIQLQGDSVTIRDNVISGNSSQGIRILGGDANVVAGNMVGLNAAGDAAIANGENGIALSNDAQNNTIGGNSESDRNVISGNVAAGIDIGGGGLDESNTKDNVVKGNSIGTDVSGTAAIPNNKGVVFKAGTNANTIGGAVAGTSCTSPCNVISGNAAFDIEIAGASHSNEVMGNIIGLTVNGTKPIRWDNEAFGIHILDGAYANVIGGDRSGSLAEIGEGNIIGGYSADADDDESFTGSGIDLEADAFDADTTTGNVIVGNLIGVGPTGVTQDIYNNATGAAGADNMNDLRNTYGVSTLADYTIIGDGNASHRNVISGNIAGVFIKADSGVDNVTIQGNYIGTDKTGELAQHSPGYTGNPFKFYYGLWISGTDAVAIRDNVISGFTNTTFSSSTVLGIAVHMGYLGTSSPTGDNTHATIAGNKIGTDKDGEVAIANFGGVFCEQLSDSTIGGSDASDRNIISAGGDDGSGILLGTSVIGEEGGCHDLLVQNNYIGTDATGNVAIENESSVQFEREVSNITLQDNLFGQFTHNALEFSHAHASTVEGNTFGIGANGTTAFDSDGSKIINIQNSDGIEVSENQIGNADAVAISAESSSDILVSGNFVGTNAAKSANFPVNNGIELVNTTDVDVLNNVVKNGDNPPQKKYTITNSAFSYSGNNYDDTYASLGEDCLLGQKGVQTIYYIPSLSQVTTGSVCTDNQTLVGFDLIEGLNDSLLYDVSAYLISKSGLYYTVLVAEPSGGPFTCSFVAANTFGGGSCDKEFLLYQKSGTSYSTQSLPSGVTVAPGASSPSLLGPDAYASGIAVMGANGDTLIQGNEITDNASSGIHVLGGHGVTLDDNVVSQNEQDGVDLTHTELNTLTSNTVTDNGNNGIQLSDAVENTIGELTEGNTISGHEVSGLALIDQSDDNTVTSNAIHHNAFDANGTGVYINESSGNTLYDNNVHHNAIGVALSSSDDIVATDNILGGTLANQPNQVQDNTQSGVVVSGSQTQGNTLSGNTISENGLYGIDNVTTHDLTHPTPDAGDNLIVQNDVTTNGASGIRNTGASPQIRGNTFIENEGSGIANAVNFGSNTSPETASDDILSEPIIGTSDSHNVFHDNAQYGVYSLDTAPTNKSELTSVNDFNDGNVQGRIRQDWYGLVYVKANDEPEEGASVSIFAQSSPDAFAHFTTSAEGFGPDDADLHDAESWQVIPEVIVSATGLVQEYAPHRIVATGSAGTASFSFNGEPVAEGGDFGNIDGRYQVATVDMTLTPNKIQGTVYQDLDGNASRGDEPGASDVTVTAYLNDDDDNDFFDQRDSVIGTTTTDGDGFYAFDNLSSGSYFITLNIPSGYTATTENPSPRIIFAAEDELRQQDFGIHLDESGTAGTATIRGEVFDDVDKDGTIDSGENGITAFSVRLIEDTNNSDVLEDADTLVATTTTDDSGHYSFANVEQGDYFVTLSVPGSKLLTTDNNPSFAEITSQNYSGQFVYDFGLANKDTGVPVDPEPPIVPEPPTPPIPPITKIINGTIIKNAPGLIAPGTGASVVNSAVASVALAIGLTNLLVAAGSSMPIFLRLLLDLFTEPFLALFGAKKLPWGKVFNSLTKRPIDLSLVRLYDARSRILAGTAVTDRLGRFKFLPKPGLYTVRAHKDKHTFPSSLLAAAPAYEKKNLYFGDHFIINVDNQTFNKDIPLDPPEIPHERSILLKLRLKQVAHSVFAFAGITISLANMIILFTPLTVAFFALHVVLLVVFWRLALPAKPKSWGRVYDEASKKPIRGAVVRIYDQKFGRLLDTAITDRNGRYGFLVGASTYYLTAEAPSYRFPGSIRALHTDYTGGSLTIEENKAVNIDIPLKRY